MPSLRQAGRQGGIIMSQVELEKTEVTGKKLQYDYPIYYRLTDDNNNPYILNEQINFFKQWDIPLLFMTFKGQTKGHWYAIQPGESKEQADMINREQHRILKEEERRQTKIIEKEISLDLLAEDGYEIAASGKSIEETIEYNEYIESLLKEYKALNPKDQRICHTIASGASMRLSASKLGVAYSTYRGQKKRAVAALRKKLQEFQDNF